MHDGGSRIEPHFDPAYERKPPDGPTLKALKADVTRAPLSAGRNGQDRRVLLGLIAMLLIGAAAVVAGLMLA